MMTERKTLDTGDKTMRRVPNRRRRTMFAVLAPLAAFASVTTVSALAVIGCGGTDTIDDDAGPVGTEDVTVTMDVAEEPPVTPTPDGGTVDMSVPPDVTIDVVDVPDAGLDVSAPPDVRLDVQPDVPPDAADEPDIRLDVVLPDILPDLRLDALVDSSDAASGIPPLGAAAGFSVLGGSGVSNTGLSVVNGNLGVWPGLAVTGFPPGVVIGGTIDNGGPTSEAGQASLTTLYDTLMGKPCGTDMTSIDLSGKTLGPGVYCFSSSAAITTVGTLTLNANGDPNAVWIFQIGSTLTTSDGSAVSVINGGSACNVFWQVGSSATIGKTNAFGGNIVAFASVTVETGSSVSGRVLARTGAVTLDDNAVAFTTCGGGGIGDSGLDVSDSSDGADVSDSSDGADVSDSSDAPEGG